MRSFLTLICFGYIVTGGAQYASADVLVPPHVAENVVRSDVVALVQVEKATAVSFEHDLCGFKYESKLVRVFKDKQKNNNGERLEFGRVRGLEIGSYYIVFIKYSNDVDGYYRDFIEKNSISPRQNILKERTEKGDRWLKNMIACGGLVPGFEYDPEAAWPVYDGSVIVEGILPQPFSDEVHVTAHEGLRWILDAKSLFLYLDKTSNARAK